MESHWATTKDVYVGCWHCCMCRCDWVRDRVALSLVESYDPAVMHVVVTIFIITVSNSWLFTSALTAVKDHENTVKLPLAIVMWIIFGLSKTLLKSSKSCGCETFRVLEYLLSIFQLYTHPCHMILSKCCPLLNGVSIESQKFTSVRQIRRDFSPTRNMTRIHVGLALSYVKLLLSSWKIYMCN